LVTFGLSVDFFLFSYDYVRFFLFGVETGDGFIGVESFAINFSQLFMCIIEKMYVEFGVVGRLYIEFGEKLILFGVIFELWHLVECDDAAGWK
jgi:hypothetical protein